MSNLVTSVDMNKSFIVTERKEKSHTERELIYKEQKKNSLPNGRSKFRESRLPVTSATTYTSQQAFISSKLEVRDESQSLIKECKTRNTKYQIPNTKYKM